MPLAQAMLLSDEEKLVYFWRARVKHRRVGEVIEDIETMIQPGSGTDIALLIGPTGAGKTTSTVSIKERIIQLSKIEMAEDLSFIPVVLISAPSSGEQKFSWRLLYVKLGTALVEPCLEKKQVFRLQDGRMSMQHINTGSTVAGLRKAVEDALKYRRTLVVIIDETVHIIRNKKGEMLAAHMDALKALTLIEGVTLTLVLVGCYDLYDIMCLNGQLTRRTSIVHFRRYLPGDTADVASFARSVAGLQKCMPIREMPDLTPMADELMHACIGCVGILKETLQRALSFALKNKGKWSDACLQKALLTEKQVTSILEETLTGEEKIQKAIFGSGNFNHSSDTLKKAA